MKTVICLILLFFVSEFCHATASKAECEKAFDQVLILSDKTSFTTYDLDMAYVANMCIGFYLPMNTRSLYDSSPLYEFGSEAERENIVAVQHVLESLNLNDLKNHSWGYQRLMIDNNLKEKRLENLENELKKHNETECKFKLFGNEDAGGMAMRRICEPNQNKISVRGTGTSDSKNESILADAQVLNEDDFNLFGRLHYLNTICFGSDNQKWRIKAKEKLSEESKPTQILNIKAFNGGYYSEEKLSNQCSAAMSQKMDNLEKKVK